MWSRALLLDLLLLNHTFLVSLAYHITAQHTNIHLFHLLNININPPHPQMASQESEADIAKRNKAHAYASALANDRSQAALSADRGGSGSGISPRLSYHAEARRARVQAYGTGMCVR